MKRTSIGITLLLLAILPSSALPWDVEVVDSGGVGGYSSLAVDASGEVHIAYFAGTLGHLKYALFDGDHWSIETVDDQYLTGHHASLDLDSWGNPRIAYRYYTGRAIRFASRSGTEWSFSEFEDDADMETDISMALDSADLPHVSYYDGYFSGEAHDLKYGHFDGSSWSTTLVDSPGQVGRGSAIALDSAGNPHISYYDETSVSLKYAHFDGSEWSVSTLDDVEFISFNFRTAIAVDSQDHARIVYSAYHNEGADWYGRLKYAESDGSQWTISVIEEALPTRDFRIPSVVLDQGDRPHVSYLLYYNVEPITGDLKYAYFDGAEWQREFVDTGDITDSAFSNSIDLSPAGNPHISYCENGTVLKHAASIPPAGLHEERDPAGFSLAPPYPNPSGRSTLVFVLPRACDVDLSLFDAGGRRVATLVRKRCQPGTHAARVDEALANGVYVCRMRAAGFTGVQKLVVR